MQDKKKIILMYVGIGVFAVILIATFTWLRVAQEQREIAERAEREGQIAADVGREDANEFFQLEKDLEAVNQAGERVKISDLKNKVWMVAQFFAECPQCALRNSGDMLNFYKKFKDHPDFHMVCVSVDPDNDDPERLQEVAEVLGADVSDWWFLTGSKEEIFRYMEEEMKFIGVRERVNEEEIATKGRYSHDMSFAVFKEDLVMVEKLDLFGAKSLSEDLYDDSYQQLQQSIERGLSELRND